MVRYPSNRAKRARKRFEVRTMLDRNEKEIIKKKKTKRGTREAWVMDNGWRRLKIGRLLLHIFLCICTQGSHSSLAPSRSLLARFKNGQASRCALLRACEHKRWYELTSMYSATFGGINYLSLACNPD